MSSDELLPIGVVARPHGVRGVLRVHPYAASSDAFATLERVLLGDPVSHSSKSADRLGRAAAQSSPPREYVIEHASLERDAWLVRLAGVDDRDAADALRGREVFARRAELPPPDEDEVYVTDLVGCALVDTEGRALGTVRAVHNLGAGELLVVDLVPGIAARATEALVPFVEPIIVSVDVEARRIVCDPPEGLLDPESIA